MAKLDARYRRYDTSNGYGKPDDWIKAFQQRFSTIIESDSYSGEFPELESVTSADELKVVFRRLVMKYHPDLNENSEASVAKTQRLLNLKKKLERELGIQL